MEQLIATRNELKDVKTQLEDAKTQPMLTDLRCKHAEAVRDDVQERCDQLVEELAKAKEDCMFARNELRRLEDEFTATRRFLKTRSLEKDIGKMRSEEAEEIAFIRGDEPEKLRIDDKCESLLKSSGSCPELRISFHWVTPICPVYFR